ncbi:MAG: hypothetical protein HKN52_04660 [Eudoraea sp.]|nr:hypothetical protein [Eudoraea sp.]
MKDVREQPLTKSAFEALSKQQVAHAVSMYMPMYKGGKEQNEGLGQANLKTCIKEVHKLLANYQIPEKEILEYLKPIEEIVSNRNIWRNPAEGLAIFLDKEEGLRMYPLPISFERQVYVAGHYYMQPLFELFSDDGMFYYLALSQDYVKLFKGSRFSFKEVSVSDMMPASLEDVVGADFKEKQLQVRSGHSAHKVGAFHGYGEGKDDKEKELQNYFGQINKAVNECIKNKNAPLVLACSDGVYGMYKKVNTYPHLFEDHLPGDPEYRGVATAHKESLKLLNDYFLATRKDKISAYKEAAHTNKTSYRQSEILEAALEGTIDTLFINKSESLFGIFKAANSCLIVDSKKDTHNVSLTNLAGVKTFLKGGNVYVLEDAEMPIGNKPLNALFRA